MTMVNEGLMVLSAHSPYLAYSRQPASNLIAQAVVAEVVLTGLAAAASMRARLRMSTGVSSTDAIDGRPLLPNEAPQNFAQVLRLNGAVFARRG